MLMTGCSGIDHKWTGIGGNGQHLRFTGQRDQAWGTAARSSCGCGVVSVIVLLMVALLCIVAGLEPELPQEREAARNRRRMDHGTFVAHMSEPEFARYYRISSDRFR